MGNRHIADCDQCKKQATVSYADLPHGWFEVHGYRYQIFRYRRLFCSAKCVVTFFGANWEELANGVLPEHPRPPEPPWPINPISSEVA